MPSRGWRPSKCRQCGRPDEECGRISNRGLCTDCATENMVTNMRAMRDKVGPMYRLYAKRHADGTAAYQAAVQAILDASARKQA